MQINIEVNETQFKDIMEKSLAALPEEKIQEVILEGMKNYLTTSSVIKDLFIDKRSYYNDAQPSSFLQNLMLKTTPVEGLNDIRDEILNVLRANYDKVLREALTQTLINGIVNYNDDSFRSAVALVLQEQMNKTNN